jgi:hypothetical protein
MYSKWIWVAQPTSTQIGVGCSGTAKPSWLDLVNLVGGLFSKVPSVVNSRFFDV